MLLLECIHLLSGQFTTLHSQMELFLTSDTYQDAVSVFHLLFGLAPSSAALFTWYSRMGYLHFPRIFTLTYPANQSLFLFQDVFKFPSGVP